MEEDDLRASENIDDRRGQGGGFGVPVGRGGLGLGTIVILGLIGWALGINPLVLIEGAQMVAGGGNAPVAQQQSSGQAGAPGVANPFKSTRLDSRDVRIRLPLPVLTLVI